VNRVLVGQYSYTACETAGPYSSVPGWKVKQVLAADFGGAVPEAMVKEAVRPFGSFRTPIVGPLTTQDEIDHLPRCLRLDVLAGDFRGLAQLAAAGRDRTGRDAFFAHGLLVGPPGSGSTAVTGPGARWNRYRPADFWGADGWLAPFRAAAIEAAELGEPPTLSAASPFDDDLRMDFIDLHPGQRDFVLAAAERALTARVPLVVLGLPIEAAMWTSIVTHFLLPAAGWSLPFATYEAGPPAEVLRARFAAVIGAPPETGDGWRQLPGDAVTVHDPAQPAARSDGGFELADGTALPIGAWARLAEQVCRLGWEDDVRAAIDALGESLGADLDRWPLFALPAALLTTLPEEQLEREPQIARLAAEVAAAELPPTSALPGDVLTGVIAATGRWGDAPLRTAGDVLAAFDRSAHMPSTDVTDPILLGYLQELLKPGMLRPETVPWLPRAVRLSAAARRALARELPAALGWIDLESGPARARSVLLVAAVAERIGLCAEPTPTENRFAPIDSSGDVRVDSVSEARPDGTIGAVLADLARRYVVPELFPDDPRATGAAVDGWPPLPGWLWRDVVFEEIVARLAGRPPGSLLTDPRLHRWIDEAAGPLPAHYLPGRTLPGLTLVDGERAAAALQAMSRPTIAPEQREVLQVAAFHRAVHAAAEPRPDDATWLIDELRTWFPGPPRAAVLYDLLEELPHALPVLPRAALAAAVLPALAPDDTTAAIVDRLGQRGLPPSELMGGPLAWHRQFAVPPPQTSHDLRFPAAPPVWPDHPETELLIAVATGLLRGPLRRHGVLRLAWWVLIVPAESLDLPGNEFRMESATWFTDAERDPLRGQLDALYPAVAKGILGALGQSGRSGRLGADVLAAEWVVRSALAGRQIPGDPAGSYFADQHPGSAWSTDARGLLRSGDRPRDELENWLHRVKRSAEMVGIQAFPEVAPDAGSRDALVQAALESAAALAGLGGLSGRVRRSPSERRG
jgi:hypothetical protein